MTIHQITVGSRLKNYYELTKPKIWYLLVFTAFGAALTASFLFDIPISPMTWLLLIGGVAAGSAAADTLTGYNDRDIDAIMDRTKGRPIPSGRISPKNALAFGLALAAISLVCAWFINIWAFGLIAFYALAGRHSDRGKSRDNSAAAQGDRRGPAADDADDVPRRQAALVALGYGVSSGANGRGRHVCKTVSCEQPQVG